jgi:glycine oxidase
LRAERLRASVAREREPALAPTVRLAVEAPDDHSVDPRLVLGALHKACRGAGVKICENATVEALELDGSRRRVTGVALHRGERVAAGQVVLATGAWTGQLGGLTDEARVPVRPVKGQILRLRDPAGPGMLGRVVRFGSGYVVPRAEGMYALGGTVEEKGFDLAPTVGGVYEMLRYASELLPGIDEWQIVELSVGLRPGTPDNAPVIGPGALDGLIWATGHHRNGILLAPLTADLVAEMLSGEAGGRNDALVAACAPERFAAASRDSQAEGLTHAGARA